MQHDLIVVIAVVLLQVGIPLILFTISSSGLLSCFPIVEQSASSWYILFRCFLQAIRNMMKCTHNSSNAIKHCTVLKCLAHTDVRSILFFPTGRRKSRQNGKAVQQNQANQLHRQKLSQSKTIVQRLVFMFQDLLLHRGFQ